MASDPHALGLPVSTREGLPPWTRTVPAPWLPAPWLLMLTASNVRAPLCGQTTSTRRLEAEKHILCGQNEKLALAFDELSEKATGYRQQHDWENTTHAASQGGTKPCAAVSQGTRGELD